jgi:single-strand DNA-binding protein
MLNHIVLMGRLTRDPELRYTASNVPVASFTVAVDRDFGRGENGEKQTDFINVSAWRQTGEFVSKYFTKGSMIAVSGRLQIREYTDRDGNRRTAAEVVADNVYFGDSKRRDDGEQSARSGYAPRTPSQDSFESARSAAKNTFEDLSDDDGELPF